MPLVDSKSAGPNNLFLEEARWRSRRVSNVSYSLAVQFLPHSATYTGDLEITFTYNDSKAEPNETAPTQGLFLDVVSKQITELSVGGTSVDCSGSTHAPFSGNRLHLGTLQDGVNIVRIKYLNDFDHTGAGLHQV